MFQVVTSRANWLLFGLIVAGAPACQGASNDGQIWSCFGLVTEDVAGGYELDTNLYFGGCSPADPGLQIVTYARATATEPEIIAECNASCEAAFARYWQGHQQNVALPIHCNTLFASACADPVLGANTASLPAGVNVRFFSGGPADRRSEVSGTVNLNFNGKQASVAAVGVVDSTYGQCEGAGQSCNILLTRLDAVATQPFVFDG